MISLLIELMVLNAFGIYFIIRNPQFRLLCARRIKRIRNIGIIYFIIQLILIIIYCFSNRTTLDFSLLLFLPLSLMMLASYLLIFSNIDGKTITNKDIQYLKDQEKINIRDKKINKILRWSFRNINIITKIK